MKRLGVWLGVTLWLASSAAAWAQKTGADAITGIWLTESKKGKVEIYKGTDGKYHGKIVWLRDPKNEDGTDKLDTKNPDPAKKKNKILGLYNLRGFVYKGSTWEDGLIYDPDSGNDYSCIMTLLPDGTLKVRGYVGISLIGKTQIWNRSKL
jgi:uncharacterized protein (DUF2147 family)